MVEYHSNDFDLDEWKEEASRLYVLPEITTWMPPSVTANSTDVNVEEYSQKWDAFYHKHNSGDFFKPRRYLSMEFEKYLRGCPESSTILEVGCGHGCSMYPIIENFPVRYVATDYSAEVLYILKKGPKYNAERCTVEHWDVTQPVTERLSDAISTPLSAIVCVFALSAVHPDLHIQCLINMRNVLLAKSACSADSHRVPGVILFRDYGIHDMTMYRHKLRYSDTLFGRADGTLSYYFDVEYMRRIAQEAGLYVLELEYATVRTENRKARTVMHRVFVHAVLSTEKLANQPGTAAQNGEPATPV